MHHRFDPRVFVSQPMHLKRIGDDDYSVTVVGHRAGRIFRKMRGGNQLVWLWTLTGPCCAGAGLSSNGDCEGLAEAKSALRATFDAYLSWAIRQNTDVSWHQ